MKLEINAYACSYMENHKHSLIGLEPSGLYVNKVNAMLLLQFRALFSTLLAALPKTVVHSLPLFR